MILNRNMIRCITLVLSLAVLPSAYSWGPEARKSIALSAYRILQYDIYEIAKAGDVSYEADLVRGAMDGRSIIEESLPIHTDRQAILAIEYEIQLLRKAREHGIGSYFAYRLGVLSALIADVMHPFGIAHSPDDERLKEMIDADIDETVYDQNVVIDKRKNVENLL